MKSRTSTKSHDTDFPLVIPSFFNPVLNPDTLAVQPLGFEERPIELEIPTKPNSGVLSDHLQIYQLAIIACILFTGALFASSCLYIVGSSTTNALTLHLRIRYPCGSRVLRLSDHAKGGP